MELYKLRMSFKNDKSGVRPVKERVKQSERTKEDPQLGKWDK